MHHDILTAPDILDFAPVEHRGRRALLVLRSDRPGEVGLELLRLDDGGAWRSLGVIPPPMQSTALDLQPGEGGLLVVWEINDFFPLALSWLRPGELDDLDAFAAAIAAPTPLEWSEPQRDRIALEPHEGWNTLSLLPEAWVFSPRFVAGAPPGIVVADAADGQAMFLSARPLPSPLALAAYPQAFAPQAELDDLRGLTLAFLRLPEPATSPFWVLPRHHGSAGPHPGQLVVVDPGAAELDLSDALGLGPVLSFSLLSRDGEPWMLALCDAPVGVKVIELHRRDDGWSVERALELDEELLQLRALATAADWSIFGLTAEGGRARLHHWLWAHAE